MLARRLLVIALLVGALGVVLAGCGGGDDNNDKTTNGNQSLVDRCKAEASKASNADVRKRAEAACERLSTVSVPSTPTTTTGGGGGGGGSRVQQCLNFVKQIPNETARKKAEAACRRAG